MTGNIQQDIRDQFSHVALRLEASKRLTGREWAQYRMIREKYAAQKRREQQGFEKEYQTRFEIERKRLIHRAGMKDRHFTHRWFATDRFERDAINRQAQRTVVQAHEQVLAHLDEQESRALSNLLGSSQQRHQKRQQASRDFAKTYRDRNGQDHRKGQVYRKGPRR